MKMCGSLLLSSKNKNGNGISSSSNDAEDGEDGEGRRRNPFNRKQATQEFPNSSWVPKATGHGGQYNIAEVEER